MKREEGPGGQPLGGGIAFTSASCRPERRDEFSPPCLKPCVQQWIYEDC